MKRSIRSKPGIVLLFASSLLLLGAGFVALDGNVCGQSSLGNFDKVICRNTVNSADRGRQTFRYATFGDEAFWGDQLQLHKAIEGAALGGVGPGVSPKTALAVGLKV